ncbi:MAG: hypothetical protein JSW59_13435 [Phycisphaerales bacterium]|nr:MAG: hypothetical protein JSW59_13435 [Phycisphaerales bacterium]
MEYVLIVTAIAVVGLILVRGRSVAVKEDTYTTSSNAGTDKHRMTSRRKLSDILASEHYSTLTDWEKHFCDDVNKQRTRLTWNQAEKIDEIWSSIKMHEHYTEECQAALTLLKEIVENPALETLPEKEKKYIRKIYAEGAVLGSYRIRRVREIHSRIFAGEK